MSTKNTHNNPGAPDAASDTAPDSALDAFFDAARATAPQPGAALQARVLADAAEVTDQRALYAGTNRQTDAARPGILAMALAAVGGWPAATALASVAALGVWIGAALPDTVGTLAYGWADSATEYDYVELLPGLDLLETEG